jgi:uncharacterized protein YjbI with pentapeptide repeats
MNEDRMAVLRMLQEGKITVDEAAKLISSLGKEPAETRRQAEQRTQPVSFQSNQGKSEPEEGEESDDTGSAQAWSGGNGSFDGATLTAANLYGAKFEGANFRNADLTGANVQEADFRGANFEGANLTGAMLVRANFRNSNFKGVDLTGAMMAGANFQDADLQGCSFTGAMLEGANFAGVKKRNMDMTGFAMPGRRFSPDAVIV